MAAVTIYEKVGGSLPFSLTTSAVPAAISALVFEKSDFKEPVLLSICQDADRPAVTAYKQQLSSFSGGLPPLGPVAGWRCDEPKLHQFMQSLGFVELDPVTDPFFTQGSRTYFYYTSKLNPYLSAKQPMFGSFVRYITVAKRHLDSIDYTHSEKINPFGMGETKAFSMTFLYSFQTLIPGFPEVAKKFKGKAVALLDPQDGEWKLDHLELGDQGEKEFLELINAPTFQIR